MPFYEYECTECGKKIEILKKMNDPDPTNCEECSGALKKLLFPAGIILKGPGFYHTEYGKGKDRKNKGKQPSDSSNNGSSASTPVSSKDNGNSTTDSKPDSTSGSGDGKTSE